MYEDTHSRQHFFLPRPAPRAKRTFVWRNEGGTANLLLFVFQVLGDEELVGGNSSTSRPQVLGDQELVGGLLGREGLLPHRPRQGQMRHEPHGHHGRRRAEEGRHLRVDAGIFLRGLSCGEED